MLISAIGIGIWAGILIAALSNGMVKERFDRLLVSETGHVQIHHRLYPVERDASHAIENASAVVNYLRGNESVRSFTVRTLAEAVAQSPVTATGVMLIGVDPNDESNTTELASFMTHGSYLLQQTDHGQAVIGQRLADKLRLQPGNRLVITFQDSRGELVSAAFSISGIFSAVSPVLDEGRVYVHASYMQELLGESDRVHEILVQLTDISMAAQLVHSVNARFDREHILARSWDQISPELRMYADMGNIVIYVIMGIILLALAFGILNTMLMSIHERFREIGILAAIGMNRLRIFTMIAIETMVLSLCGASLGMGLAAGFVLVLSRTGIDFGMFSDGLKTFGYETLVYPEISFSGFVSITLMVCFTALAASVYPAWKALKIDPAQAVHE